MVHPAITAPHRDLARGIEMLARAVEPSASPNQQSLLRQATASPYRQIQLI